MLRRVLIGNIALFLTASASIGYMQYRIWDVVDSKSFIEGFLVGIGIGCVTGMLLIYDLTTRIENDRIGKPPIWRWPVYFLILAALISLYWLQEVVCKFFQLPESYHCSTYINAALCGTFVTTFVIALAWNLLWEHRHKCSLYW